MQFLNQRGSMMVATLRLKTRAITPLAEHVFAIDRKRATNPALDKITSALVKLLQDYLSEFKEDQLITVKSENLIAEQLNPSDPFFIAILAEAQSGSIPESMLTEMQGLIKEFARQVLDNQDDIFCHASPDQFSEEQYSFVTEHAKEFVSKFSGVDVAAPFTCEFSGQDDPLPVQGKFKRQAKHNQSNTPITFHAISHGANGSELHVFLQRLDDQLNPTSTKTEKFIAESQSLTKKASLAHASDFSLVYVTAYEKLNEKGKSTWYVKELQPVACPDPSDFQVDHPPPL